MRTKLCGLLFLALVSATQAKDLLLDRSHGDEGTAWRKTDCAVCHPLHHIHTGSRAANIRNLVRRKGYDTCTGCHGSNGTQEPRRCVLCHNPADLPASPRRDGAHNHLFTHLSTDGSCLACHQASDMDGILEPNQDLTLWPDAKGNRSPYFGISEFCIRCHNRDHQQPGFEMPTERWRDPLVAAEDNYNFIDKHGRRAAGGGIWAGLRPEYSYPSVVACSDCHAMHGSDNSGLLIDSSAKGASRLMMGGDYPVWTGEGEYAQLCVLCHDMENPAQDYWIDTGNGFHGVHQAWGDCRDCHQHGQANQPGL